MSETTKDIGWAVAQLHAGETVTRETWVTTRRRAYIRMHWPENEKLNRPFPYQVDDKNRITPYEPTASDLMARDWQLYNPLTRAERAATQAERQDPPPVDRPPADRRPPPPPQTDGGDGELPPETTRNPWGRSYQ